MFSKRTLYVLTLILSDEMCKYANALWVKCDAIDDESQRVRELESRDVMGALLHARTMVCVHTLWMVHTHGLATTDHLRYVETSWAPSAEWSAFQRIYSHSKEITDCVTRKMFRLYIRICFELLAWLSGAHIVTTSCAQSTILQGANDP